MISLCSFAFINHANSDFIQKYTQNTKTENSQNLNKVNISYAGGQATCTSPSYAIKVNCDFKETLFVPDLPILYKNLSFIYQQIITMTFGLLNCNEIQSITYDNISRTLNFASPAYFYEECEIVDNPQNMPGMPQLPKRHTHGKLLGVKLKNAQNAATFKARSFLRNTQIRLRLDQDITRWGINRNDIKFQNLLKIDANKTFRGFQTNYFGLEANNEYLKALIIKQTNQLWINSALSNTDYKAVWQTANFQKIIELMRIGNLVDFENEYVQQIADKEILNNQNYNVHYWAEKILNPMSQFTIESVHPIKYVNWVKEYELGELTVQHPKLLELLFNNQLSFSIDWITSNNTHVNTTEFALIFSKSLKVFKLLLPDNRLMLIEIEDLNNQTGIIINSVKLINNENFVSDNEPMPVLDPNYQFTLLNNEKYFSNPIFDITKLISPNNFDSVFQWMSLLDLNKYTDLTDTGIPTIIEHPERLIANNEYIKSIMQFENENSVINIYERKLKKYLLSSHDTLFGNDHFSNVVANWKVMAYNSKNQIIFDFEFKDINAYGKIDSQKTILKRIEFNLTPYTNCESSDTVLVNSQIKLDDDKNNATITKLILDKYIKYKDQPEINSYVAETSLNKQDWIDNAFIDLEVLNKDEKIWLCKLRFKTDIYKNLPKVQTESSISFSLEFNGIKHETILPPDTNSEIQKNNNFEDWIMWASIVAAIILIITLVAIYIHTKKKSKRLT